MDQLNMFNNIFYELIILLNIFFFSFSRQRKPKSQKQEPHFTDLQALKDQEMYQ